MIKIAAASKKGQKASFIAGLRYGSDELDLVCLNDDAFQTKMEELALRKSIPSTWHQN